MHPEPPRGFEEAPSFEKMEMEWTPPSRRRVGVNRYPFDGRHDPAQALLEWTPPFSAAAAAQDSDRALLPDSA